MKEEKKKNLNFEICITSFEVFMVEFNFFSFFDFKCLVVDESHRLKNQNSKISKFLRDFKNFTQKIFLCGTLPFDSLENCCSLMSQLLPESIVSEDPIKDFENQDPLVAIENIRKILKPFILRRLKIDLEKQYNNK